MILWALTLLIGLLKSRPSSPRALTPRASSPKPAGSNKPSSAACSSSPNRLALTDLHAGVGRKPGVSGDWEYQTWITE
jgi:hypothetical protein